VDEAASAAVGAAGAASPAKGGHSAQPLRAALGKDLVIV